MTATHDPAAIGTQIESVIQRMGTLADAHARGQAQELVRLLMTLYGAGLSRVLDIVRTEEGGPAAVVERLAADGLVGSLLVLHDLHPHPVDVRIQRALTALGAHFPGIDIVLAGVDGAAAHLRLERGASAGPPPGEAVRVAIERAVQEAAPEIGAVHIEGLGGPDHMLIQILRRPDPATPRDPA